MPGLYPPERLQRPPQTAAGGRGRAVEAALMELHVHQLAMDIATTVYRNRADSIFPMALPAVTSSAENCSTSTAENSGASEVAAVVSWEAWSVMTEFSGQVSTKTAAAYRQCSAQQHRLFERFRCCYLLSIPRTGHFRPFHRLISGVFRN